MDTTANTIFFRKLIENSHEGISLLNKDFSIIYRSPSSKRINGIDSINEHTDNISALIHPEDLEEVVSLLQELLLSPGQSKTCSFRSKHADGHFNWLKCTFTNMLHEPDVNAIVCNFKNISNEKQAEDLLNRNIEELSTYKYALDEAAIVAITDQKGMITHVNDNFCNISKYSREELIGKDHRIINSSSHSKAFIRNLWTTIANGKTWKNEMKNKAKDGSFYWVDTTIIPFLNKQGKPYQYVAIRSDITERKISELLLNDLNISLQKQAKELAVSNSELEQFAYVASHDLQEPLRMVTSFLTQLELKYGDVVDDRGKKYIHFAVDGAKRMRQIILDLLEFSRVGRFDANLEEVNLDKIISDILVLQRKKIEEQNAEVFFDNMPILLN